MKKLLFIWTLLLPATYFLAGADYMREQTFQVSVVDFVTQNSKKSSSIHMVVSLDKTYKTSHSGYTLPEGYIFSVVVSQATYATVSPNDKVTLNLRPL